MASEEEDFLRGGTSRKHSESKIVFEQVDNLFQVEACVQHYVIRIVSHASFSLIKSFYFFYYFFYLFQSNELTEIKKRKGGKVDGKQVKKQRSEENNEGLTLNTAAKSVEILHLKVKKTTYACTQTSLFNLLYINIGLF